MQPPPFGPKARSRDQTARQGGATPHEVDDLVRRHFLDENARHGPYAPAGGQTRDTLSGRTLIPGVLFRYELVDPGVGRLPLTLQLYTDIGSVGGRLWEQELRVLLRLGNTAHPALPRIMAGDYESEEGFAFVVTRSGVETLQDDPDLLAELPRPRLEAVRQLRLLADALAVLASSQIAHRNLWPGTVDLGTDDQGQLAFRLARFEMSTMVANLLRAGGRNAVLSSEGARRLFLDQGPSAFPYFPPERLKLLFTGTGPLPEHARSDIFSLGVLAWQWFTGSDLPITLSKRRYSESDGPDVLAAVEEMRLEMTRTLAAERQLTPPLRRLLAAMLQRDPRERPRADQVVAEIDQHYEAMVESELEDVGAGARLVAFIAREFVATLHRWGYLIHSPVSDEGRVELADLIESDLSDPLLVHSEVGAGPFVRVGDANQMAEARQVLVGKRFAWFGRPWVPTTVGGRPRGEPSEHVLLLKYVVRREESPNRDRLAELVASPSGIRVGAVEALSTEVGNREVEARSEGRPRWNAVIAVSQPELGASNPDYEFEAAFDWLLEFQEMELQAREYSFDRVGGGDGHNVTLRWARERDDDRWDRRPLAALYARDERRRPPFGEFFDGLSVDGNLVRLEIWDGETAQPVWFERSLGADEIEVSRDLNQVPVPERGRVRPHDDRGTHVALRRQMEARPELLANRQLVAQLRRPAPVLLHGNWEGVGASLTGEAGEAARQMLEVAPIFAVQGPPGTGKTTVAAHAIRGYLEREPGARVLVSAQSNYALDHLAMRVLGLLDDAGQTAGPGSVVPLRAVSRMGVDRVEDEIEGLRLEPLTVRIQEEILHRARVRLKEAVSEVERQSLDLWVQAVERAGPELADRIRRGANLVFATCVSATPEMLSRSAAGSIYDWVVVEEAAKAWPTELAIPLARGLRWTLLGDHHQLPAHRRREVEDFLAICALDPDPSVAVHGARRKEYLRVFDLFADLFRQDALREQAQGGRQGPAATRILPLQFRMPAEVAEIVSRVFYPEPGTNLKAEEVPPAGRLRTARRELWPERALPRWAQGSRAVWVDTACEDACEDRPAWMNPGEAEVVTRLVASLQAVTRSRGRGANLRVLTPYRHQADLLRQMVGLDLVSTVHAFQGREADVVVVSLVRDRRRGDRQRPWESIGHLTQPELVNVMFSRARELLVVVGSLEHFRDCGVDFWGSIAACFGPEGFGRVVEARTLLE